MRGEINSMKDTGIIYYKSLFFYTLLAFAIFILYLGVGINYKRLSSSRDNIEALNESSISDKLNENQFMIFKASKGDSLAKILKKYGINQKDIHNLIEVSKPFYNMRDLKIGQEFSISFIKDSSTEDPKLVLHSLKTQIDRNKILEIERSAKGDFVAKEIPIKLKKYIAKIESTINNSFIKSCYDKNIPRNTVMELVKIFSYDVDFQREIQPGDSLDVLFEKYYNDKGEFSHDGNIIAASLKYANKTLNIYRYTNSTGEAGYYNADGDSIKKELLRTPLNVINISSKFGMRKHPILGFSKMHKGVDFAASIGTPIFAAGSGVIEEIGKKGAYGNYIRIKHNNMFSTAYAHASSFAKHLRQNSKVKQGEVIAYVGATGRTNGPHLHYEVLINNQHVNPMSIKLSPGKKLSAKELSSFRSYVKKISTLSVKTPDNTELAMESFKKGAN